LLLVLAIYLQYIYNLLHLDLRILATYYTIRLYSIVYIYITIDFYFYSYLLIEILFLLLNIEVKDKNLVTSKKY